MYTWLPVVVDYEIKQKREEGCDVAEVRKEFDLWLESKGCAPSEVFYAIRDKKLRFGEADLPEIERIYHTISNLECSEYESEHPDELSDILAQMPEDGGSEYAAAIHPDRQLYNRIYGGWLGRAAGCVLGKPVELWDHATVVSYLQQCGAYPLNDFIPELTPMPKGYKFKDEYEGSTKGAVAGVPRDDDMDYPIMNLQILEKYGPDFTTDNVGQEWLRNMPYELVYTAERVTYKNMVNGLLHPVAGNYRNPYREWIGAQIRADVWGWVNPGNPKRAATMAYRDAKLSHAKNGIYGEMWVAAMIAIAFVESEVEQVIVKGLRCIPAASRLSRTIQRVLEWSKEYEQWTDCFERIRSELGFYHSVHTLNNAAIVAMALLYSKGDYHRGITISVMAGWDTDCNGATVGSILGVMIGADGLPEQWVAPLQDRISTLIHSMEPLTLSDLAERTLRISELHLSGFYKEMVETRG